MILTLEDIGEVHFVCNIFDVYVFLQPQQISVELDIGTTMIYCLR